MKIPLRKATISLDEHHLAEVEAEDTGEQRVYVWAVKRAGGGGEVLQWGHEHSFEAALQQAQERLRRLFRQSLQVHAPVMRTA